MNEKGFTLIELLSVIIILGIILSIAVPQVLNVIQNSKEQSFESNSKMIARTIEQQFEIININNSDEISVEADCQEITTWDNKNGICIYNFDAQTKEVTITIIGAGKFNGLIASGTKDNIIIQNSEEVVLEFSCGQTFIDSRDNKQYRTIQFGTQCWFRDNLSYINTENDCTQKVWNTSSPLDACMIHQVNEKSEILYQWDAAMNGSTTAGSRGLCPEGWNIPTDGQWKTLEIYLGMTEAQANSTTYRGTNQGTELKDVNGFNGTLAGYRFGNTTLNNSGTYGAWWSSSDSFGSIWRRGLQILEARVERNTSSKNNGLAVRCMQIVE